MSDPRRPTDAELRILQVLWERGQATVREVHEALEAGADQGQATGYTTVLKQMQIMLEKGLVERDESRRTHVYAPARSQDATQRQLLRHLLDRAFSGSAGSLALAALADRRATPEEAEAIRRLLDEAEAARDDGTGDDGEAR